MILRRCEIMTLPPPRININNRLTGARQNGRIEINNHREVHQNEDRNSER